MTKVKFCGLKRKEDVDFAVSLGADFLGFVFAKSPRQVGISEARKIMKDIPGHVKTVGVFADVGDASSIIDVTKAISVDLVQIHGAFAGNERVPGHKIIRAARVRGPESAEDVLMEDELGYYAVLCDAYCDLLMGGTGKVFDWKIISELNLKSRLILAGGLNPDNVWSAIHATSPFMVDVSSGVEAAPGQKDHDKMKKFMSEVRRAESC